MNYHTAKEYADKFIDTYGQYFERIAIAGSVRREKKRDIKDVEIVGILDTTRAYDLNYRLKKDFPSFGFKKKTIDQVKYIQLNIGCTIDLFITSPECWGCIYLIRTGSAKFSEAIVGHRKKEEFKFRAGRLYLNDEPLETPEEEDVFRILRLQYVLPKDREGRGALRNV